MSSTSQNTEVAVDQPAYGASLPVAFRRFWRKYATFSGRASRSEYWWWALVAVIVSVVIQIIASATGGGHASTSTSGGMASFQANYTGVAGIISGVWFLATIVPTLALTSRRLHDANLSALLILIAIVPFLGELVVFVILPLISSKPAGQRFDRGGTRAANPARA
ncbi:hypothetical protein GCM10025867_01880 [Frondihabitans sucicola]|uniref:DUF805 domain-containing protein n=1 Tax=Frondihabitans sucicola TaxID=1268041 RepID=A0ABM8GHU4_9MICO|nr:DUF805 domain-containing protein [Frondihabitans sucicola]BDZ47947.1 hypothetical protein GCM10025867_01880 [Frondihabitans sucicola]